MIRFCDKMAYSVLENEMTRGEMLSFFLQNKECENDVIMVYEEQTGEFLGIATYDTLLVGVGGNKEEYINTARVCVGEDFWDKANEYFAEYPKELLTVTNEAGEVLGCAYYEDNGSYIPVLGGIECAEKQGLPILVLPEFQRIKMLVITDLNELAWRCRKVFMDAGLEVCVVGEKWEWFGLKSGEGYLDYADFQKLYLYAEGTSFQRNEKRNVKSRLGNGLKNFEPLVESFKSYSYHVCISEIEKLVRMGTMVYEISIPMIENIEYITKSEYDARMFNIGAIYEELTYKRKVNLTEKVKNRLEESLGKNVADMLIEQQIDNIGTRKAKNYKIGPYLGKNITSGLEKKIYLVGPCIVGGERCVYEETLLSCLSKLVEADNYMVIGLAIGNVDYNSWERVWRYLSIREDDIILIINQRMFFKEKNYGCKRIDMTYIYNDCNRNTLFSDEPIHSNAEGNQILAREIYENCLKEAMECGNKKSGNLIQKGQVLSDDEMEQFDIYIQSVKKEVSGEIGSIVMNCNPFTYGHQYLIEYAASKVDWLYVFVVEENRSYFQFDDRIEMVKQGTSHLENVIVVPSGKFVLSYETMPIYFEKAEKQEAKVDARLDLEIFACHIAEKLHITKRFVGEEPFDKVTNQYNDAMKQILERYGLELEIIPRKEIQGEIISATKVRKYMEEGNWDKVRALVPETTVAKCKLYGN